MIRASRDPNEAVELPARNGRLDVSKTQAQQLHLLAAVSHRDPSTGEFAGLLRVAMEDIRNTLPSRHQLTSMMRIEAPSIFLFPSGRPMFQSTRLGQSKHLRRKKTPPVLSSTSRVRVIGNLPLRYVVGALGDKISNFLRPRRRTDLFFFSGVLFISAAPPGLLQVTSFVTFFRTMHFHSTIRQTS